MMKNDINIVNNNNYFKVELAEKNNIDFFNQFTNWLSSEFDLFLQEDLKNKFIVYFPNGNIIINYNITSHLINIIIKSKMKNECAKISNQVLDTYILLKNI